MFAHRHLIQEIFFFWKFESSHQEMQQLGWEEPYQLP